MPISCALEDAQRKNLEHTGSVRVSHINLMSLRECGARVAKTFHDVMQKERNQLFVRTFTSTQHPIKRNNRAGAGKVVT